MRQVRQKARKGKEITMIVRNSNGYLYSEDVPPQTAVEVQPDIADTDGPSADEIIEAVCQDSESLAIQMIQGSSVDDHNVVTINGANVGIETTQNSMFLYMKGDAAQVLYPYIQKYKASILDFLEGKMKDEPYILISFIPGKYEGAWFLGCSSPDACFATADDVGKTADGICMVFSPESVGFFESDEEEEEEDMEAEFDEE